MKYQIGLAHSEIHNLSPVGAAIPGTAPHDECLYVFKHLPAPTGETPSEKLRAEASLADRSRRRPLWREQFGVPDMAESFDNRGPWKVYPNAEIIVPSAEMAYWTDEAEIAKLPDRRKGLAARIGKTLPTWKNVREIESGTEVAPGVMAVAAYGHTPGHTTFQIASGDETAMILADTANVPALFVANPTWRVAFDADGAMAAETRKRLFDMAVADRLIVTGYHFGFPGSGRIERDGAGYAFVPSA